MIRYSYFFDDCFANQTFILTQKNELQTLLKSFRIEIVAEVKCIYAMDIVFCDVELVL